MQPLFRFVLATILSAIAYTSLAQPANDEPCNATLLTLENTGCEASSSYSYFNATPSGFSGCINGTNDADVWYRFTVPSNGQFTFHMAPYPGNPELYEASFYTGTCNNLIPFQGFTNISCFFSLPYTGNAVNLTPNTVVYFRVYRPNNGPPSGSFLMCVSNNNSLADVPCNAGFLNVDAADPLGQGCATSRSFSYTGATLTPAVPNPSCQSVFYNEIRDSWFKVRVPASGKVVVNAKSDQQTLILSAYTGGSCSGPFTQLSCSNNGNLVFDYYPGGIVFVRCNFQSFSPITAATISLCAAARNDVPPVNDISGKVGIGIDSPFTKLDVTGSTLVRSNLSVGGDADIRGNLYLRGKIINLVSSNSLTGQLNVDSLALPNVTGNKIALWGGLGGNSYGFGVQSGLLQMFTQSAGASFAFGFGNSHNFNERIRFYNQGEYGMQVNGRLVLRNGLADPNYAAGVWLNKPDNSGLQGFMGIYNASLMGFYGGTRGWGLTYSTVNSNLGIGNSNPTRPLSFPAELGEKILLYPGNNGEVGIGVYGNELRLHADNPGAKVSFGTQDNAGVFTEVGKFEKNGAYGLSVFGSIWANGTTYASDGRFKKNVEPLEDALDKVLQLQGVSYQMKAAEFPEQSFDSSIQVGLIAQEVEKIVPEVVSTGPNGYKAIDYAKLVPLLIESIKAQQAQLDAQKKEIELLKKQWKKNR